MTDKQFAAIAFFFALLAIILVFLPRDAMRNIRHILADIIMWQWRKTSLISAKIYAGLWQRGNGA